MTQDRFATQHLVSPGNGNGAPGRQKDLHARPEPDQTETGSDGEFFPTLDTANDTTGNRAGNLLEYDFSAVGIGHAYFSVFVVI